MNHIGGCVNANTELIELYLKKHGKEKLDNIIKDLMSFIKKTSLLDINTIKNIEKDLPRFNYLMRNQVWNKQMYINCILFSLLNLELYEKDLLSDQNLKKHFKNIESIKYIFIDGMNLIRDIKVNIFMENTSEYQKFHLSKFNEKFKRKKKDEKRYFNDEIKFLHNFVDFIAKSLPKDQQYVIFFTQQANDKLTSKEYQIDNCYIINLALPCFLLDSRIISHDNFMPNLDPCRACYIFGNPDFKNEIDDYILLYEMLSLAKTKKDSDIYLLSADGYNWFTEKNPDKTNNKRTINKFYSRLFFNPKTNEIDIEKTSEKARSSLIELREQK